MSEEITLNLTINDAELLLQIIQNGQYAGAIVEDVARVKLQVRAALEERPRREETTCEED